MQASFAAFIFVSCGRRAACGCAAVIEATRQSLRTVTALPSERHRITLVAASPGARRSEEHTSELQSLMRISYAVFCLKKKNKSTTHTTTYYYILRTQDK